jgi:Neuraminidase (sialidase)
MRKWITVFSVSMIFVAASMTELNADLVLTVTDAGSGKTNWTLSGSGTMAVTPFDPNNGAEVLIGTNFGNFGFVNGGDQIVGTGTWFIADLPSQNSIWFGEGSLDGANDWLYISFGRNLSLGTDLSTARGTVQFDIDIAAFNRDQYFGNGISDGQRRIDPGLITINVSAVPEPSSILTSAMLFSAFWLMRRKARTKPCTEASGRPLLQIETSHADAR